MTNETQNAAVATFDLAVEAKSLEQQTGVLHGSIKKTAATSKEIMVRLGLVMKAISVSKDALKDFRDLAASRKITLPKGFDPSTPQNNGNNPALIVVRVLVGEFDANGNWVPSIYAAKNFPGVVRWLTKAAETSAEGLTTVLDEASAKVGAKRTVKGVEAAKALDRDEHGKKRTSTVIKASIPFAVGTLKPVATFKADPSLFPVNDDGFGVGTIRLLADGKYGIFFGVPEDMEVEAAWALGYEAHKHTLSKKPAAKSFPIKGKTEQGIAVA